MRKGIEAKQSRNVSETVVFADKLFAFLDFQFEVVVYNRFTRALTERFAKSGFSVMQFCRKFVERNFSVEVLLEYSHDLVFERVGIFHFGNEYSRSPNPDQENMAHEVIDYGADAVLGSHPYVTQGIEMYKGKPIFYSLGNFIFDMSNSATHIAYIVKMDFVNDTGECTVYPVIISGYLPYFMGPD